MSEEKYYMTFPALIKRMQIVGRQMPFKAENTEDYAVWANSLRGKLADCIGLNAMIPCDIQLQELGRVELDGGLTKVKMLINTEPDVQMPFYMILPSGFDENAGKKTPAVICCHGHGSAGKSAVTGESFAEKGADCDEFLQRSVTHYNYTYGLQLAREGYITFCPDARGFGERREEGRHGWGTNRRGL